MPESHVLITLCHTWYPAELRSRTIASRYSQIRSGSMLELAMPNEGEREEALEYAEEDLNEEKLLDMAELTEGESEAVLDEAEAGDSRGFYK